MDAVHDFSIELPLAASPLATVSASAKEKKSDPNDKELPSINPAPLNNRKEEKKVEDDSLVEIYADRLCAVTHAFALCCSTVQKSSGM